MSRSRTKESRQQNLSDFLRVVLVLLDQVLPLSLRAAFLDQRQGSVSRAALHLQPQPLEIIQRRAKIRGQKAHKYRLQC